MKRQFPVFYLIALAVCLLPFHENAWSQPIHIVSGTYPSDIERYTASELMSYLLRLTGQHVSLGSGKGIALLVGTRASNPALGCFHSPLPETLATQEILVRSGTLDGQPAVAITGGSPSAVLWAAYALLEKLGVVFEFSGEIVPPKRARLSFKDININETPSIAERGMRLHLNFPMDQSSYSLPEFLTWVDRLARMKFNYLELHFYGAQPWFLFQFHNVLATNESFFVGSQMFGGKYELPTNMIGRGLIHNKAIYFPPELEGVPRGKELYLKTEARIRAVIDHAHARGIKVCLSFEPMAPPPEFVTHLKEWDKEYGGRDKLMHELTVARLNACMDAYPNADELQLISQKGSSDAPRDMDLKAELKRLCDKYKIPLDPNDERQFAGAREAGVNLTPYNAPSVATNLSKGLMRPVVSTLRFVDLALNVLSDPRIANRLKREGDIKFEVRQNMLLISNSLQEKRHFCFDANPYAIGRRGLRRNRNVGAAASSSLSHFELESTEDKQSSVGIYLPNASAIKMCLPALRVMMPPQSRLQMMVDYGARGTADQMTNWDALRGANLQLGVISWLEFDGSMFLPETWPRSVYDCVQNAKGLPLTTLVCNSWRVSGLEADAATLAGAPWATNEDYDTFMHQYFTRVFGLANADQARSAYDALEQATLYCRAHLFNIGFCWEGRYVHGVGYPQKDLDAAMKLFDKARGEFNALARHAPKGRPRQRAELLANRCSCAHLHVETMSELAKADVPTKDSPARIAEAPAHADKALELARQYMQTYSKFVLDRGDEGMLVNYHFAVLRRAIKTDAALHKIH